jgi:uncharacterized membrane protein YbhN (UPF0104 family)
MKAAQPTGRRWWVLPGQILVTVVVTVFLFRQVGVTLEEVRALDPGDWRPDLWWLLASVLVLAAGFVLSGILWGRMVRELGGPDLDRITAARIYMVANLGRYVPGKVWQLVGLTLLARREQVPAHVAATAAVLGQGTALAGASVVGAAAFLSGPSGTGALLAGLWTAGVLIITGLPPLFRRVVALSARVAGAPVPDGLARDRFFGIRWVVLYALNWIFYGLGFWMLARTFSLQSSPLGAASAFAAAYVLGYLALFAPAGLGIREGFLVAFLNPIMGAASVGLAVVARLWTTAVELVVALGLGGGLLGRGIETDV